LSRILVVGPSWIGDAVLSHPLLVRLRERDPSAAIDVLAPSWALPVYRRMPEVARTLELPFGHGELRLAARRRFARTLDRYDEAIVLPNTFKSALVPWHARIAKRTGYRGEMRYGLLNDLRRLDEKALPLIVERYAALAQPAGEALRRPLPEPRLAIQTEGRAVTVEKYGLDPSRAIAAFAPGAEYGPSKRWPARHFATLAAHLVSRGYQVWIFGSPKDAAIAREIVGLVGHAGGHPGRVVDLTGRTALGEAIDLLSLAAHVVTNDSGLMHIAAALDRPSTALFGSSSPSFTPPLSRHAQVISLKLACSPCFRRVCPLGHTNCLEQLEPARVLAAIDAWSVHP
jgi:heptosyltransferase-2